MLLQISGLTKTFGGYAALRAVDMTVAVGSIHALIGPNGAGKTTLFNVMSGVLPATSGRITFLGHDLRSPRPDKLARMGIARTFQSVRLFGSMSALDNVLTARFMRSGVGLLDMLLRLPGHEPEHEASVRQEAMDLLELVGLARHHAVRAGDLALADQRRLEMARALATEPKLLLLDEPVAGMNPVEVQAAAALIRQVRDRGVTVVLSEHHMSLVMQISDVVTVLNYGEKIAEGTPETVRRDPQVLEAYLGTDAAADGDGAPAATQEPPC